MDTTNTNATTATLTSKGQTTIPKAIRKALEMKAGDRMTFTLLPDRRLPDQRATPSVGLPRNCTVRFASRQASGPCRGVGRIISCITTRHAWQDFGSGGPRLRSRAKRAR